MFMLRKNKVLSHTMRKDLKSEHLRRENEKGV